MTCPSCGAVLPAHSQFCVNCAPDGGSRHTLARFAGLLFLLLLPTAGPGVFSGLLAMKGDPAATLAGIQDERAMFEVLTVLGAVGFIDFLVLAVVLHRLFRPIGKAAADLMLAFVAVSVPISLAALGFRLEILTLLDKAGSVPMLAGSGLADQVFLALGTANNLMQVSVIFWGLWLLPLAWLVYRCGFIPRILAVLLALGSPFYVVGFLGTVFDPNYQGSLFATIVGIASGIPDMVGEFGTALWLLIKGTGAAPRAAPASPDTSPARPDARR